MRLDSPRGRVKYLARLQDTNPSHTKDASLVHATFCGIAWNPVGLETCEFTNAAIHVAAVNGRNDLLELLLNNGADVNAIGYEENKGLAPAIVLAAWESELARSRRDGSLRGIVLPKKRP